MRPVSERILQLGRVLYRHVGSRVLVFSVQGIRSASRRNYLSYPSLYGPWHFTAAGISLTARCDTGEECVRPELSCSMYNGTFYGQARSFMNGYHYQAEYAYDLV